MAEGQEAGNNPPEYYIEFSNPIDSHIDDRDRIYSDYLEGMVGTYTALTDERLRLKTIYFWIVMSLLILITLSAGFAIVYIAVTGAGKPSGIVDGIPALAAAFGSLLASFIIIPRIIAEHLFPSGDEIKINDIIKLMQDYDEHLRAYRAGGQAAPQQDRPAGPGGNP